LENLTAGGVAKGGGNEAAEAAADAGVADSCCPVAAGFSSLPDLEHALIAHAADNTMNKRNKDMGGSAKTGRMVED
jgi:hypothetical protein